VSEPPIPFLALTPHEDLGAVQAAIDRVISNGRFVLGPEVDAFEAEFAAASGAAYAVGVGNGTDALALILRALDIGRGDEVITTPLSAAYTALAIMLAGARPVFADIDLERLTISPEAIESAVTSRTRAILPVHLYGRAADMAAIERIASRHALAVVEDCCQAHLATAAGRAVGTIGVAGAFSFYPTKNLGALGDGGAVVTGDRALAARLQRLRNGGQTDRYHHQEPGFNSRLDELQAAILRARLPFLATWTARRRALALQYRTALAAAPGTILPGTDPEHVYHLFVVRCLPTAGRDRRGALQRHLRAQGIETLVHYPVPVSRQPALAEADPADCRGATDVCGQLLSLPLHPHLSERELARVAAAVLEFTGKDRDA
jgi:dTDP-3-amino-3,4,6-trideoxy-alpha-D-glucose transaminase